MRKIIAILVSLSILLLSFVGCSNKSVATDAQVESDSTKTSSVEEITPEPTSVRVLAAGDNLIHSSIYKQAKERGGDNYDFDFAYEKVEDMIALGELAVLNQETVIAPDYEPSDYPCFNSPKELAKKMISLGFNAFNHSNNHILDKGTSGVKSCMEYWEKLRKKNDIVNTGVYADQEDLDTVKTLTVNDIKFSFIGATQHTNGISLPSDTDIKVIYTDDEDEIERLIKRADKESDVVVMNVHWGTEDSHIVTDGQRNLAKKMVKWGADIIIGTHPHVLQEVQMLKNEDGKKVPVIYSLGNFISAQSEAPNMIGGIAAMNVTKDYATNEVTVSDLEFMPVITHYSYGFKNIQTYPYYLYSESLASSHGVRNYDSRFSYSYINDVVKDTVGKKYFVEKLSEK